MQLNLAPAVFYCSGFSEDGESYVRRLVVLSPVVLHSARERVIVSWGCSLGKVCLCPSCRYSAGFQLAQPPEPPDFEKPGLTD